MTRAGGLPCDLGPRAVLRLSAPRTSRGSLAVALQLPLFPCSSLADALAPGWRSALDGAATAASGNGGNKSNARNTHAPSGRSEGSQAPPPSRSAAALLLPGLGLDLLAPVLALLLAPVLALLLLLGLLLAGNRVGGGVDRRGRRLRDGRHDGLYSGQRVANGPGVQ